MELVSRGAFHQSNEVQVCELPSQLNCGLIISTVQYPVCEAFNKQLAHTCTYTHKIITHVLIIVSLEVRVLARAPAATMFV